MEYGTNERADEYSYKRKRKKRWKKLVTCLAAIAVFCTTYALILPAITWSRELICELPEHTHSDACFEIMTVEETSYLWCSEDHEHTDGCYSVIPEHTEKVLICHLEEHSHTDSCYTRPPKSDDGYYCGHIEHQHNADCYNSDGSLRCTIAEHVHILQCQSNIRADVETAKDWESSFVDITFTGNWANDVLAVADTQLGYSESSDNFMVNEAGQKKGYTRYGAKYGDPYGDWCAMFCSFCIEYAEVEDFPVEASCNRWIELLSAEDLGLYYLAEEYNPRIGDLVFFDWDEFNPESDDEAKRDAEHVGLVYEIIDEEGNDDKEPSVKIKTIEGNANGSVDYRTYDLNDSRILGYGKMPKNPEMNDTEVTITARARDGATVEITGLLPKSAKAEITPVKLSEQELVDSFGEYKAAALTEYVAYDIKIMVDGEEWQPDATVSVVVKKPNISIDDNDALSVAHIESESGEAKPVESITDADGALEFSADGFSVYVIYKFTVDFHYNDITYSIPGKSEALLSDIFAALGIDIDVTDVEDAAFSDKSLLITERLENGDWKLISLEPFTTDELLIITLSDGTVFAIETTDAIPSGLPTLTIRSGGTTTLIQDCVVNSTVTITGNTTLDLNGHKLYANCNPLFNITSGTLTIKDSGSATVVETTVTDKNDFGNAAGYGKNNRVPLTAGNVTSSGFSPWGDGAAANLFDGSASTKIGGAVSGGTVTVEFTANNDKAITAYSLVNGGDTANYTDRAPSAWRLQGYTGSSWVTIDERTSSGVDLTTNGKENTFELETPVNYSRYRIRFTTGSAFQMADIKLFEPAGEEGLVYYVTETEIADADTGVTTETLKKYQVLDGGMIIGNDSGRAVTMSGGTLNLEGGYICSFNASAISGDSMSNNGGAIAATGGTINQKGSVIAGNKGSDGGGIYVTGSNTTLNITGGVISGNDATRSNHSGSYCYGGGGVYLYGDSTVNMNGGYVTNNVCSDPNAGACNGGGGFMVYGSTLNVNGGYITGNTGPGGGGIMTARVNSYANGGKVYMTGGFVTANAALKKEGGGISLDGYGYMKLTGGYVTNNRAGVNKYDTFADWGGGGIFVSDAQALLYVENALVTENHAGGFGGGIAGCSTGRLNIAVEEVCANFNNTADGTRLSGSTSSKNEDHLYAAESSVFMENGYQDYYCALSSIVSGGMLGGGTSMWTGSVDGEAVTSTSRDDELVASSVMGLTSHPSDADIAAAEAAARVFINGNDSPTHGGGILANGYLVIGPQSIESFCRLEFNATKNLLNDNDRNVDLGNRVFTFTIVDENGTVVSKGVNDSTGEIIFDRRLAFTAAGTYKYYAYEEIPLDPDNAGVIPDTAKYEITVDIVRVDSDIYVGEEHYVKHVYQFQNVKIEEMNSGTVTYNKSPGNNENHAVSLDPTGGRAFNNHVGSPTAITAKKTWASGSTAKPVTVVLYRNGEPIDTQTLSSSNNWTYTWTNLDSDSIYDVRENVVPGYTPTYKTTYTSGSGSIGYYVPATSLSAGEKYIVTNSTGGQILTANGSIGRYSNSGGWKTSSLTINGRTYNTWYDASQISSNCVLTAESGEDGVGLKNGSSYLRMSSSGLLVGQSGHYFTVSSGSIKRTTNDRYLNYSNNAFSMVTTAPSGSSAVKLFRYVEGGNSGIVQLVTITNSPVNNMTFKINLLKTAKGVDGELRALPGAEFALKNSSGTTLRFERGSDGWYIYGTNASNKTSTLVTETNGYIRIKGLPAGTYTLCETVAPSGYSPVDNMTVTLGEDTPEQNLELELEDPVLSVLLPETGGIGTTLLHALGTLLTAGAIVYGISLRRKRERRYG